MINLKDIPSGALHIALRQAALGATADAEEAVFYADVNYKVLSVGYIPDSALTGATSTARSLALVDKGTDGAGTTAVKTAKAYATGVDMAAYDYDEIIAKSDAKTLTKGHVYSFKATHASTGTALPAGLIVLIVWPISE